MNTYLFLPDVITCIGLQMLCGPVPWAALSLFLSSQEMESDLFCFACGCIRNPFAKYSNL